MSFEAQVVLLKSKEAIGYRAILDDFDEVTGRRVTSTVYASEEECRTNWGDVGGFLGIEILDPRILELEDLVAHLKRVFEGPAGPQLVTIELAHRLLSQAQSDSDRASGHADFILHGEEEAEMTRKFVAQESEVTNERDSLTPRELFSHSLGSCYRTEIDVANGERGWWQIGDLDGNEICVVAGEGKRWKTSTTQTGELTGEHESFLAALDSHLAAIQATGGAMSDDLFWCGTGLPRWA